MNNKINNPSQPQPHRKSTKQVKKKYHSKKTKPTPKLPLQETLSHQGQVIKLQRYPHTEDRALRAWSNAELFAVNYLNEQGLASVSEVYTYNDRFGVWNCLLNSTQVISILSHASQEKAIQNNQQLNQRDNLKTATPLDKLNKVEVALVKVPKSVALFELFLQQIHQSSVNHTQVVCCFMTKFFAKSLLTVAESYFEEVEQSQAWKKARLLILKKPKIKSTYPTVVHQISYNQTVYHQYYGVFSAEKIDIGTQFLLEQYKEGVLMVKSKDYQILDLACGNGVIARELSKYIDTEGLKKCQFTVVDDFILAIESAKMNMQGLMTEYVCDDTLESLTKHSFDLVVSNPPFHFEHESNIEVAIKLFGQVHGVLKTDGRFVLVANKHLNYETHLTEVFKKVFVVATNRKFEVYECVK